MSTEIGENVASLANYAHRFTVGLSSTSIVSAFAAYQDILPMIVTVLSFLLAVASFLVNSHYRRKDEIRKQADEKRKHEMHEMKMQVLIHQLDERRANDNTDTGERRRIDDEKDC